MKNSNTNQQNAHASHCPLSIVNCQFNRQLSIVNCQLKGMTLVELLVAVSIMVLLVAISVPMFKPMLESQKTAGAARTVAMALERAKVRAMETGKYVGVEFERFSVDKDKNDIALDQNFALRLRLVRNAKDRYTLDDDFRVKVKGGVIEFYTYNGPSGTPPNRWVPSLTDPPDWDGNASLIQFGRQGRYYKLDGKKLAPPFGGLDHPVEGASGTYDHPPVEYRIKRQPRPMLIPPIIMPRGTVVDLQFSGEGIKNKATAFNDISSESVIILFSPNGTVDRYFFDDPTPMDGVPRDPLHFCIGEWERALSIGHEDGRRNIDTASNFWVTVHPRTGAVRISEMNTYRDPALATLSTPPTPVEEARKFATENFVNIGGF